MPRVQLYKIRRLVQIPNAESRYEWLQAHLGPHVKEYPDDDVWTTLEMDGQTYVFIGVAQMVCQRLKDLNRTDKVIFHSVVPA